MLTIGFSLDAPRFAGVFTWEGDEQEAANTIAAVVRAARSQDVAPEDFMLASVVHAPAILSSKIEVEREMAMMAITAWVLQQPTRHPDHPGLIGDYLPVGDLNVTFFHIADGEMKLQLEVSPRADLAGSA